MDKASPELMIALLAVAAVAVSAVVFREFNCC